MKNFFKNLFKNNNYMLFIDLIIIVVAYYALTFYLKNAPIKTYNIDGINYVVVGGVDSKTDKYYFQLKIKNKAQNKFILKLNRPYVKFFVTNIKKNKILFEFDFKEKFNDNYKNLELLKNDEYLFKKMFDKNKLKFVTGKYNLTVVLMNEERYQFSVDFNVNIKKDTK